MSTYNSISLIHLLVQEICNPNLTPAQKQDLYRQAKQHMRYVSSVKLSNLSDSTLLKLDILLKTAQLCINNKKKVPHLQSIINSSSVSGTSLVKKPSPAPLANLPAIPASSDVSTDSLDSADDVPAIVLEGDDVIPVNIPNVTPVQQLMD